MKQNISRPCLICALTIVSWIVSMQFLLFVHQVAVNVLWGCCCHLVSFTVEHFISMIPWSDTLLVINKAFNRNFQYRHKSGFPLYLEIRENLEIGFDIFQSGKSQGIWEKMPQIREKSGNLTSLWENVVGLLFRVHAFLYIFNH